jgi:dihydrofolate synthase/folylpolyglutamate synthase
MSYPDTIGYLYSLQKYGIKLGLEKPEKILSCLGNPHRDFLCIHIAGTNGKGSVSAMTASILMAHGFKVGLYTSPHLVSFTERIRINNKQIDESEVVRLTEEIKERILEQQTSRPADQQEGTTALLRCCAAAPTFFEFVTAMAFLHFSKNNVDWAVIETGMGGRLDATNLITPEVSVITRISYDHKEFLGETISAIAGEKAGIIKNRVPVVSTEQEKEAHEIIAAAAKEKSSSIFIYGKDFGSTLKKSDLYGITFDYHDFSLLTSHFSLTDLFVPLAGDFQVLNACVAIKTAMVALKRAEERKNGRTEERKSRRAEVKDFRASALPSFSASELPRFRASALKSGLASTKWHGRLEIVSREPLIMVDGAHNPDAASILAEFIKKHLHNYKIILIMGIMSDKDVKGIMSPLLPLASDIIFTAPNYGRAASPQKLAEIALHMGFHSKTANSVKDAIDMALKGSNELGVMSYELKNKKNSELRTPNSELQTKPLTRYSSLILITGSLYTIGEAMEMLGEKPILGTLRETV